MGIGIHPIFLIAGATLTAAIICGVFASRASGWIKQAILLTVALVLLAPTGFVAIMLKPELVDARFRTYKLLYRDIQVGMTRSEVKQLVRQHYPPGGKRMEPKVVEDSTNALGYFMNPEDSREPNCEGIFLEIKDHKVVRKQYSAD
jgi:hypothetical protein